MYYKSFAGVRCVINVCTRLQPRPSAPGGQLLSIWQRPTTWEPSQTGRTGRLRCEVWLPHWRSRGGGAGRGDKGSDQGWVWGTRGMEWPPASCATEEEWTEWCVLGRRAGRGPGGSSEEFCVRREETGLKGSSLFCPWF